MRVSRLVDRTEVERRREMKECVCEGVVVHVSHDDHEESKYEM